MKQHRFGFLVLGDDHTGVYKNAAGVAEQMLINFY